MRLCPSRAAEETEEGHCPGVRRGVRFVNGAFKEVLGPGSYSINENRERIEIVDLRPQPVLIELFAFKDSDQNDWIISLSTNLLVSDPYASTSKLKNQVNDSVAIIRDALRNVVSKANRMLFSNRESLTRKLEEILTSNSNLSV